MYDWQDCKDYLIDKEEINHHDAACYHHYISDFINGFGNGIIIEISEIEVENLIDYPKDDRALKVERCLLKAFGKGLIGRRKMNLHYQW